EDGIRDDLVTGVQTCALPICFRGGPRKRNRTSRLEAGQHKDYAARKSEGARLRARKNVRLRVSGKRDHPLDFDVTTNRRWRNSEIGRASCRERVEMTVVAGLW